MSGIRRMLGLAADRWDRLTPSSVWSASAIVVVAWGLMALSRLGGLTFEAPRAFLRLTLVGVWGWLGLAVAVWSAAAVLDRADDRQRATAPRPSSLRLTLAMTGWAHTPIQAVAVVVIVAAGAMQLLGPGLVVAVLVFGILFPLALLTGTRHVYRFTITRAAAVIAVPYAVWLLVVARFVLGQVRHLL